MTLEVLILLLAFQAKHLIADYYLQFEYMYMNKGNATGWVKPLFDHAGVHYLSTFLIVYTYFIIIDETGPQNLIILLSVVVFDFVTHFITDRWKATRKGGPDTSSFWTNLGIDQMVHHVVGILIVWYITTGV